MKKNKKVLEDHDKKGKRLIPPLMQIGNFKDASYVEKIIPEILWLAMLNNKYGIQKGTEYALELVKTASHVNSSRFDFSFISSYELLSEKDKKQILMELEKNDSFFPIKNALRDLIKVYPECPLAFLVTDSIQYDFELKWIKELLIDLYDKKGRTATFMMGNVIYFLGALGRLHLVGEDSMLARLPELRDYPETPVSRAIASGIRAAMNAFMHAPFHNENGKWINYFWKRGMDLEPCLI